jgi:hypothetical protein
MQRNAHSQSCLWATIAGQFGRLSQICRLIRSGAAVVAIQEFAEQGYSSILMSAAITATIATAITARCNGLENMCRRIANRVPSGTSAMPHVGHVPDMDCRTARCIGQT